MTRREMKQRIRELEKCNASLEARVIRLEQRDPVLSAKPRKFIWKGIVLDDSTLPRPKPGENGAVDEIIN